MTLPEELAQDQFQALLVEANQLPTRYLEALARRLNEYLLANTGEAEPPVPDQGVLPPLTQKVSLAPPKRTVLASDGPEDGHDLDQQPDMDTAEMELAREMQALDKIMGKDD